MKVSYSTDGSFIREWNCSWTQHYVIRFYFKQFLSIQSSWNIFSSIFRTAGIVDWQKLSYGVLMWQRWEEMTCHRATKKKANIMNNKHIHKPVMEVKRRKRRGGDACGGIECNFVLPLQLEDLCFGMKELWLAFDVGKGERIGWVSALGDQRQSSAHQRSLWSISPGLGAWAAAHSPRPLQWFLTTVC